MTDESSVTQMLADYYAAFSTLDIEAIVPYFHRPALAVVASGVFSVSTAGEVATFFKSAIQDLRSRGYGRSEFELRELKKLNASTVSASGVAVRYKTDGQELERVGITYLLHNSEGRWKIAVMILHDKDADPF